MKLINLLTLLLAATLLYHLATQTPTSSTPHRFYIARDTQGIPHVYSKSKKDLMFGMGYAAAQDRLWTYHIKRLFLRGRLAELFGAEALPSDF